LVGAVTEFSPIVSANSFLDNRFGNNTSIRHRHPPDFRLGRNGRRLPRFSPAFADTIASRWVARFGLSPTAQPVLQLSQRNSAHLALCQSTLASHRFVNANLPTPLKVAP